MLGILLETQQHVVTRRHVVASFPNLLSAERKVQCPCDVSNQWATPQHDGPETSLWEPKRRNLPAALNFKAGGTYSYRAVAN